MVPRLSSGTDVSLGGVSLFSRRIRSCVRPAGLGDKWWVAVGGAVFGAVINPGHSRTGTLGSDYIVSVGL